MNILSVEAWAENEVFDEEEEEIVTWNWNSWSKVGECASCENEHKAWEVFTKFFGFTPDKDKYHVEDDQYNYTLCVTTQGARPIYAIEYGAGL